MPLCAQSLRAQSLCALSSCAQSWCALSSCALSSCAGRRCQACSWWWRSPSPSWPPSSARRASPSSDVLWSSGASLASPRSPRRHSCGWR
ncbi:MAG TPA: hypothetical protein VK817_10830 [Trebonia sp.]|nr:hypothetical protein [Trebonia sp.]